MTPLIEQFLAKLLALVQLFQEKTEDIPVISILGQMTFKKSICILAVTATIVILAITAIIFNLFISLPRYIRERKVKKFFCINDLSHFRVRKMGKVGSRYYSEEGVNSYQLALPKWKYADNHGSKEQGRLFNKVIWQESILWLHMRGKAYALTTTDPWEMIYLVKVLRDSSVEINACKQELDKQELIERAKPATEEFIQNLIAQLNNYSEAFCKLCYKRLKAQGMQVMDAPKNNSGINFFAKRGNTPYLIMCQLVPYKHLNGLEELKKLRSAADSLFTKDCILITTGRISIAAASYARENNIEVICTEQLANLMDETAILDPKKTYLQWQLLPHDLNIMMPEDLLAKILS